MIKNKKLILLLVFSLLVFILSYTISLYEKKQANYKINVEKIEFELHSFENKLENIISTINKEIKTTENEKFWSLDNIKDTRLTVLIYKNKELKYWSNNTVPVNYYFSDSVFKNNKIINLKNGWYQVKTKKNNNIDIVGLLKIKNNYFYENQYLKTKFVINNEIPSSVILSTSPISIGKNIYGKNGKYLFSLIPSQNSNIKAYSRELPFIFFFISIVLFLLFFNNLFFKISDKNNSYLANTIIAFSVIFSILFLTNIVSGGFLKISNFFTDKIFVYKFINLCFGKLLVFSVLLLFLVSNLFRIIPFEGFAENTLKNKKFFKIGVFVVFIFISYLFFNVILTVISNFIKANTSFFNLRHIFKSDIYLEFSYLFVGVLFFSFFSFIDHFLKLLTRLSNTKDAGLVLLISLLPVNIYMVFAGFVLLPVLTFYLFILLIFFIRFFKQDYTYLSVIFIVFVFSVFFVIFENKNIQEHEIIKQNLAINNLANERDETAEYFLREINNRIEKDTVLQQIISDVNYEQDLKVHEYLMRKYFYGFWEKYTLSVVLCGNTEIYTEENQAANCKGYYLKKLKKYGKKINSTNFWFVNDNTGKIIYTGIIELPINKDQRNLSLYITLNERLVSKRLGYPKLLIDKSAPINKDFDKYSYAKYNKGVLIVKSGKYYYDLTDKNFNIKNKKKYLIETEKYKHLVLNEKNGQRIVLSKEKVRYFDLIISFAYLFVLLNLFVFVAIIFSNYKFIIKRFRFDFTTQIRLAMIFILLLSFVFFGAGTVYFAIKQNKKTVNKEIADKVQSVLVELKHKLENEEELTPAWRSAKYDHLDELLIKFSQVFFSDINLYDINGFLLATSRAEIFNKGLIGKQMNSEAYKMMFLQKKTEFINEEHIGNLHFASIYVPLKNENNKIIAYINLPYFIDNNRLQNNIFNVFIATLNLYLVLFLITIFIAFIISTAISRPLRMLQSKFKAVQLGKKQSEIIYNKKDEIGALVKEYNSMVTKLEKSAKKLAESERESAWREMAKQIAHEIKNPLTPMKLSIQLLQKTWIDSEENNPEFEKRLNSVSRILIEQIDTLSSIASEFSAFAKMPKARNEEVDIVQKLKSVTALFENTKNIDINLELNKIKKLNIITDKEQVSRVFINLIKNAIQAIPKTKQGEIEVSLINKQTRVIITVKDNGKGIPDNKKERLFEPSFTTKSTGMGIGLAIVKNIVNSAGGDIWFESKENKGTKFYVEFLKT